jgi:hypothetical protein
MEKEDANKKDNKANDKVSKFSKISKNVSHNIKKNELIKNKTKGNFFNEELINDDIENSLYRKKSLIPQNDNSKIDDLSEVRKLNDLSNLKISELNISNNNDSEFDPNKLLSSKGIEKLKFTQKKTQDTANFIRNKSQITANIPDENNLAFFQNILY